MDLSMRLGYLFGTEEYVNIRRQLVLIREKLLSEYRRESNESIICSGSLGEGVNYPKSDNDEMCYPNNYHVVRTFRDATSGMDILLELSEDSPGYCSLRVINGRYPLDIMIIMNEQTFISSTLWKHLYLKENEIIHGPCISFTSAGNEYDFARCLFVSFWPDIAYGWVRRNTNKEWPSNDLVREIVNGGCHVVPIGPSDSTLGIHQWRLSFSLGERSLMHSLNHAQFLTYNLLRLTLKRIIEEKTPGVLCSYFMKTTLFYAIENTPLHLWNLDNLETCFKICLSVLFGYVQNVNCPNHFIPEYNMIQRKINHGNQYKILDVIRNIHDLGIITVLRLCGESFCLEQELSLQQIERKQDHEFFFPDSFYTYDAAIRAIFKMNSSLESCTASLRYLWLLLDDQAIVLESTCKCFLFHRSIEHCCRQMMGILLSESDTNKLEYKKHKSLYHILSWGLNCDVTTGKLSMAIYMYLVGKTESAMYFVRNLLSEYPPYALDKMHDDIKTEEYRENMCGRGYTITYKAQHALVQDYNFYGIVQVFPMPLSISTFLCPNIRLNPLLCAFVLESLCNIRLEKSRSLIRSTRCIRNFIDDNVWASDNISGHLCIGIVKYVQGDNHSACRWFSEVYKIASIPTNRPCEKTLKNLILFYVACLLYRHFKSEVLFLYRR